VKDSFIDIQNISLSKQDKEIIKDFSLDILNGEKINIFGKNGSGKTSLIKIFSGITCPTEGEVTINPDLILNKNIFYIGHKYGLKNELSIRDNLNYIINLNQVKGKVDIQKELNFYNMETSPDAIVKYLSHGQKKIISLVGLTLVSNKIWILDEPFTGLDQSIIDNFMKKIENHVKSSGTVIITSHDKKEGFKNIELC
tara:strand:+ start:91 stop:684 length:594 start_codon:yes stop_codon:yes gene_type:complete